MMRIEDFPRPKDDNGRGVHWSGSVYHPTGSELDFWMDELQAMKIKWVKVMDDGGCSSLELCQRLLAADIMPVVRMFRERPNPGHLTGRQTEAVRRLIDHGVRYFETNNEPDLPAEWRGSMPDNWLEVVVDNFIWDADFIISLGGLPALPPMGPGSKDNPVGMVVRKGRGDLFENGAWVAIHNYTLNHPLDYPDDDVNQQGRPLTSEEFAAYARWAYSGLSYEKIIAMGVELTRSDYDKFNNWAWDRRNMEMVNEVRAQNANPGDTIFDDPNCFRGWEAAGKMIHDALGFYVPVISTEGGPVVGWGDDNRYAKANPQTQMEWQLGITRFLQSQAPPWYFSCCTWIIAAIRLGDWNYTWEQMAWYTNAWDLQFGLSGKLPLVQALKDEPSVVRPELAQGNGVIEGTVRTVAGRPLAGLSLRLFLGGAEARTAKTDAEGRFRFQGLAAGRYDLGVAGYGLVQQSIELSEDETRTLDLRLGTGWDGIVEAIVRDTTGALRSGVTVTLLGPQGLLKSAVSDAGGRARFAALGAGLYRLRAESVTVGGIAVDGWGTQTAELTIPAPAGFRYAVAEKRLLPREETGNRRIFYGVVTNAAGEPLNGIAVQMSWADAQPGTQFPRTATGKDPFKPAGYYEFLHTAGEFQLQVTQGDWESDVAAGLLTVNVPGREGDPITYEVNFRLQPLGEPLTGCAVQGSVPGLPAGRRLILRRGEESWAAAVDEQAAFAFPDLTPGAYVLELETLGRIADDVVLAEGDRFRLTFPLQGVIEGQALGGQPPLVAHLLADRWDWPQRAPLDAEGRFRFQQLPPGSYRLEVAGQEFTGLWVTGPGTLTLPAIKLEKVAAGSAVRGRVLDAAGLPQPGVTVQVRLAGSAIAETHTGADGGYGFEGLAAGAYELFLPAPDISRPLTVDGLTDAELDIVLPAAVPEKVIVHYLLFGPPEAPGTRTNLLLAQPYLRRSGATAGFSLAEAARAQRVTIVGDETAVSAADEAALRQAGCDVTRLAGDSYALERLLFEEEDIP